MYFFFFFFFFFVFSFFFFFFFFSSRRRHTRLTCDWSSDVCSSDLDPSGPNELLLYAIAGAVIGGTLLSGGSGTVVGALIRSEERRVGKECRSRWSPYH